MNNGATCNLTSDGRWNYTWDAKNRLISMTVNTTYGPQNSLKFDYDAKGRRIRRQVWPNKTWSNNPTNDVKYLYDGWNLMAELDALNSNARVRTYTWGLDLSGTMQGAGDVGGLLEVVYYGAATTNCFVAYDGNGNVTALLKADGSSLTAQYEYGPFGENIRATGPMAKCNPFRFSTKYQDDESDLVYYGYRFYNGSMGRWLSRDPINELGHQTLAVTEVMQFNLPEEENPYLFARNSTPNLYDKDGRLAGYAIAAIAVAAYECAKPQVNKAWRDYANSGDKFKHCWVSCRISKTCGNALAQLAGISKELRDRAVAEYCKSHPEADICQGGHGDLLDSIGDMAANQKCIGWETKFDIPPLPVFAWIGGLCRRSCEDCCKAKVGYYATGD